MSDDDREILRRRGLWSVGGSAVRDAVGSAVDRRAKRRLGGSGYSLEFGPLHLRTREMAARPSAVFGRSRPWV
jgi:hypothetical protein